MTVFAVLAEAAMVVHLAFLVFVAAGPVLAWRWRPLVWLHVPALAWSVGIIAVGYACPLTSIEKWLRRRAGDEAYDGGFVDRYVEDVVYPDELTPVLWSLVAGIVLVSYTQVLLRRGRRGLAGA